MTPVKFIKETAATGDFDADVAGTTTGGTAIATNNIDVSSLSCLFVCDIETNTITVAAKWQVSDDNSTYYDMPPENNAALVVLGTGTAGADATVSKVIPCPPQAKGWRYVRPACVVGVTTGAVTDTYSMQSYYRRITGF